MSEANGVVLIKAPAQLLRQFDPDSEKVQRKLLLQLFDAAAVEDAVQAAVFEGKHKRRQFFHEGIERHAEGVQIAIFGDEWSHPLQALVRFGVGVEIYGSLHHEDGRSEYFALDPQGRRCFKTLHVEGGWDPDEARQTVLDWQASVPASVHAQFPAVLAAAALPEESTTEAPPPWTWAPQQDADFVDEYDGVLRLKGDLLVAKHYRREHLVRAQALGAGLVIACDDGEAPRSDLHWIITSLEHNVAEKTRIALDMLEVFEFDLSLVCRGYGENVGTALYLAARKGLYEVVSKLVDLGAPVTLGQDGYPLRIARTELAFEVMMKRKPKDIDMSTRTEGVRADYEKIVALLEGLPMAG